jgi:hypothetical protein
MDEAEVLLQMILAIKNPFLTRRWIMMLNVLIARLRFTAEYARHQFRLWIHRSGSIRRTEPSLQADVDCLFVSLPFVFLLECLSAKRAFKGFYSITKKYSSSVWVSSASPLTEEMFSRNI